MKKGTKIGLWVGGLAVVGFVGYLIIKRRNSIQTKTDEPPIITPSTTPSTNPKPVVEQMSGGNAIYTFGLGVPTYDSPDVMSLPTDMFALSGQYVGWKVGVATNGIGTAFYKFLRDKKYGYIRQLNATLK